MKSTVNTPPVSKSSDRFYLCQNDEERKKHIDDKFKLMDLDIDLNEDEFNFATHEQRMKLINNVLKYNAKLRPYELDYIRISKIDIITS